MKARPLPSAIVYVIMLRKTRAALAGLRIRAAVNCIVYVALLALEACAVTRQPLLGHLQAAPGSSERECAELFVRLDEAIGKNEVGDADAARVTGFPYLRVNRLLASFADGPMESREFEAWVDLMRGLDDNGRRMEIANLPDSERVSMEKGSSKPANLLTEVHDCADLLRARDLAFAAHREALRAAARVPDDYRFWQRVAGLYPLTAIAFSVGTQRLYDGFRQAFSAPVLTVHGRLIQYRPPKLTPPSAEEVAVLFQFDRPREGLQIPVLPANGAAMEGLFARFAPILEVDTANTEDQMGAPRWRNPGALEVDTEQPAVYHYLSYTRFGGRVLPQLNYTFWFPERALEGPFDLLGGHLDGITWRLTLDIDGSILVADAIHNCGCYHLFFPSDRLRLKPRPATLEETAFAPQSLPSLVEGESLVVRIAHHTHFIERVLPERDADSDAATVYALLDYDRLRSLPLPGGGAKSAFGSNGIVAGSERAERYFYWPMGVPSAGAMRQRGHHATAFVGRRHFDDPNLFEESFELLH